MAPRSEIERLYAEWNFAMDDDSQQTDEERGANLRKIVGLQCAIQDEPITSRGDALIYLKQAAHYAHYGRLRQAIKEPHEMIEEAVAWLEAN